MNEYFLSSYPSLHYILTGLNEKNTILFKLYLGNRKHPSEKSCLAKVILWFLLLSVLSQQDSVAFEGLIVSPPEGDNGEGLPIPHHHSPALHIKLVIMVDTTIVPSFLEVMSLHVKQGISLVREVLLTFSLRRIWFYFIVLTGAVVFLHRRKFLKEGKNSPVEHIEADMCCSHEWSWAGERHSIN